MSMVCVVWFGCVMCMVWVVWVCGVFMSVPMYVYGVCGVCKNENERVCDRKHEKGNIKTKSLKEKDTKEYEKRGRQRHRTKETTRRE